MSISLMWLLLAEYDDTIQCALPHKSQYYDDLFG